MSNPAMTPYHVCYYAHDLTRRSSSDSIEKLGSSLFNATVDLNPHQLDAALFAFRSPLSRGAILADEVGLGKTIEAGLVISQLWAERKRRILVIAPAILRKQWAQELADKFAIDSQVIDTKEFKAAQKAGQRPLEPKDRVAIVSYHFAAARRVELTSTPWDLVVIDEAHRLRNVYRPKNKIANAIKASVQGRPILLLTATPLQNDLLELYGLVSVLDDHLFGDIEAFKARYMRGPVADRQIGDLRETARDHLQADPPATGHGVRPFHRAQGPHPGLHPHRGGTAALRPDVGVPPAGVPERPPLGPADAHDDGPPQAPGLVHLRHRGDAGKASPIAWRPPIRRLRRPTP